MMSYETRLLSICYILFICMFLSCTPSQKTGSKAMNKFADLNHHYQEDQVKQEAARFLLKHLDKQYHLKGLEIYDDPIGKVADRVHSGNYKKYQKVEILNAVMDTFHLSHPRSSIRLESVSDMQIIDINFLIENIDLAFDAYECLPPRFRVNEKKFREFVLPYKSDLEVPEPGFRKMLRNKYAWIQDALETNSSIESMVCTLLDSIKLEIPGGHSMNYRALTSSQLHHLKFGRCGDMVNLAVNILRSQGIAACADYTPMSANYLNGSHSWLVLFTKERMYKLDVEDLGNMEFLYRNGAYPKFYRKSYMIGKTNEKYDVTHLYKAPNNVALNIHQDYNDNLFYLSVFKGQGQWKNVAEQIAKDDKVIFRNIGTDLIYALLSKDGESTSVWYVDGNAIPHLQMPDFEHTVTAKLTRKYPPFCIRNVSQMMWRKSIVGCEIIGANSENPKDAEVLYRINDNNVSTPIRIRTEHGRSFKYYGIRTPENRMVYLAEFALIMNDEKLVKDISFLNLDLTTGKEKFDKKRASKAFDQKPLTSIWGRDFQIMVELPKKAVINSFIVQSRTADNDISSGDEYELMYWRNGWQSLGRKLGISDTLEYSNVPKNTVYWLKNLSKGREEHLFLLDGNGNQYWPSVTPFIPRYEEFIYTPKLCQEENPI